MDKFDKLNFWAYFILEAFMLETKSKSLYYKYILYIHFVQTPELALSQNQFMFWNTSLCAYVLFWNLKEKFIKITLQPQFYINKFMGHHLSIFRGYFMFEFQTFSHIQNESLFC